MSKEAFPPWIPDWLRPYLSQPTTPIPVAGRALGYGRGGSYQAAKRGDIPTIAMGHRKPVPTEWLRRQIGLDQPALRRT
jgi:hypothetical protein